MSYPTSQQLAELRAAFAEAEGVQVVHPTDGGAFQSEREMGIGWRQPHRGELSWNGFATAGLMRQRTAELRGRAYPGLSGSAVDELERTYGIPYAWRMTLDQWPELPQPTWGGFTAEALEAVSDA